MPSFSSLLTVVLLAYSVSLFQLVVCILAESPSEEVITLLRETRPDYDLSGKTISGNLNIFGWKELFTNLHMSLPIVPVYIVIIILSVVIIRHLKTTAMSEQTKTMHSQLFKALIAQAFLPAFYLGTILVFVLEQAGILNSAFLEYAMMQFVGVLPVISPIFTLYFVLPYRRWIIGRLACKERGVVTHSGLSTTVQTIVKI